ncbi:hypothetical protein [Actinomadura macra]|nr:hypothetical protein [Actinomadura macra]
MNPERAGAVLTEERAQRRRSEHATSEGRAFPGSLGAERSEAT